MDLIENAREELKRADHLIFVSLKYTRTCDIILNTIKRLIESFDYSILALLEHYKEKKKIVSIPETNMNRSELLLKKGTKYKNAIKLYSLLKKIEASRCEGREEYRKHVTMIVHLDKKVLEVTVPILEEYFKEVKEFVNMVGEEIE